MPRRSFPRVRALLAFALSATGAAACGSGSYQGSDAGAAGTCMISASSYDQSCALDTDCTPITAGNYCSAMCLCGGSTINKGALAQFNEDVSKTPLGSGAFGMVACNCGLSGLPCCRHGVCQAGFDECSSPADTLPACAEAGGTCTAFVMCFPSGPPNSCAYSDEACCIK